MKTKMSISGVKFSAQARAVRSVSYSPSLQQPHNSVEMRLQVVHNFKEITIELVSDDSKKAYEALLKTACEALS